MLMLDTEMSKLQRKGRAFPHIERQSRITPSTSTRRFAPQRMQLLQRSQARCRAQRRHEVKAQARQAPRQQYRLSLVRLVDTDESSAAARQSQPRTHHGFGIGLAESLANAHHLTCRMHLGAEDRIDSGKFTERKNRRLDVEPV